MLQAVVGDHDIDIRMRRHERLRRSRAPTADPHRQSCSSIKQRLVADDMRIIAGRDCARHDIAAPITTTDDSGIATAFCQRVRQRERERRLAGAADRHVTDDDNRDPQRVRTD